jgi:hypothetical protein
MRLDSSEPSPTILNNGDVRGRWRGIPIPADIERNCLLNNMHTLIRRRLLAECNQAPVERALLVREITENRFQYIAAINLFHELQGASSWGEMTVTMLSDP